MFPYLGFIDNYSLMLLIGIGAGIFIFFFYLIKIEKIDKSLISPLITTILVSLLSAFLVSILTQNLYRFLRLKDDFKWEIGFNFYGGCLGLIISFLIMWFFYLKKFSKELLEKILIIAPSCVGIGFGFMRIGCFLKGCCFGIETTAWYGVVLPGTSVAVIPINLFESILLFIFGFVLLFTAIKYKYKYNIYIGVISYTIFRFVTEDLRTEKLSNLVLGLKPAKFWSLVFLILCVILLILRIVREKKSKKLY